jgi:5-methylcytosine-specific restriction endonuclease McrA
MAGKRPQAVWCGGTCRDAARRDRNRERDNAGARERHLVKRSAEYDAASELWAVCLWCGDLFRLSRENTHCQGEVCQRAVKALATRVHVGAQRVREAGFDAEVEAFSFLDVYDRGRGVCYLCDRPTLTYLLDDGRRPASATLDHVVPVELGGAHTLANVRLAHFRCNAVKGRRTVEEARAVLAGREPVPVPERVLDPPVPLVRTAYRLAGRLAEVPRERPGGQPLADSITSQEELSA